jgi:hypothetical protein
LFRFFPPSAATPFAATSPLLLKHRLTTTFHPFPLLLKHRFQLFIHFPDAETPLFSILFIPFPSSFPLPIIDETIPSSNCFASFVAETPFTSNLSSFHP